MKAMVSGQGMPGVDWPRWARRDGAIRPGYLDAGCGATLQEFVVILGLALMLGISALNAVAGG